MSFMDNFHVVGKALQGLGGAGASPAAGQQAPIQQIQPNQPTPQLQDPNVSTIQFQQMGSPVQSVAPGDMSQTLTGRQRFANALQGIGQSFNGRQGGGY